jgi:hypothetical protein
LSVGLRELMKSGGLAWQRLVRRKCSAPFLLRALPLSNAPIILKDSSALGLIDLVA